jgi:hypothetical protein
MNLSYQFHVVRSRSKTGFVSRSYILSLALSLMVSTPGLHAQGTPAAEGEKLERQMWADSKAKDWKAMESKIAEGFQSIHPDGARDQDGEISLIERLNLGEFTLSNFQTTVNGDNIVVTYIIAVQETIDGKRLSRKPSSCLSVWKRTERLAMDLPRQLQSNSLECDSRTPVELEPVDLS